MRYPREIYSYFTGTKTFSIEAHFTHKEDDKPLEIFGDFSRFVFTIIQEKVAINGNLNIEELASIRSISDYAMSRLLAEKYECTLQNSSPAYTMRFATGSLKGKTPVEVRLENGGDGINILNGQYEFLKKNLGEYPNNEKLMNAISEAIKLDLSNASISTSAPIEVFSSGPRPWVRKTREDKKCLCYEIRIVWDNSRRYPVNVRILNYYAPVVTTDQGTLNVSLKEKDVSSEKNFDINMSASSWLEALRKMESVRDGFEVVSYARAFKLSDEAFERNRTGGN